MRRAVRMLTTMGLVALAGCFSLATAAPAGASAEAAPRVPGLAVYESRYGVAETSRRVQEGLQEAGMVTAVVDHAANAAGIGEELRPTTLVIGGSPPAGTPLLLEDQRVGIDLPQKYLTWQAENGTVYLAHNSAEYLAARTGIPLDSPALDMLRAGSARISATAAGNDRPLSTGSDVCDVRADGYLVERTSDAGVAESIARYEQAFLDRGLTPVATVDHARNAESIGAELAPTRTTFVGDPMAGTPLLQADQTIGIDLPTRYLAWEDGNGTVHVAHPDIRELAQRHAVTGVDDVLAMIETATAMFTATAAGSTG